MMIVLRKSLLSWLLIILLLSTILLPSSSSSLRASKRRRLNTAADKLTREQRDALSRAIMTAVQSEDGEVDMDAMEEAVQMGVPRDAILTGAEMAIERTKENQNDLVKNSPPTPMLAPSSIMKDPRTVVQKPPPPPPKKVEGNQEALDLQRGITDEKKKEDNGAPKLSYNYFDFMAEKKRAIKKVHERVEKERAQNVAAASVNITTPQYDYMSDIMTTDEQEEVDSMEAEQKEMQGQQGNTAGVVDDPLSKAPPPKESKFKKRKFIEYVSSEWEKNWIKNIDQRAGQRNICQVLLEEQTAYLYDYLELMCTSRMPEPFDKWCIIDDGDTQLWYNTKNWYTLEILWERPEGIPADIPVPPPQAVVPELSEKTDKILSKMIFEDEESGERYTEYIEPLVSHLRFPLSKCLREGDEKATFFKGFILPPPPDVRGDRFIFFDGGSPDWQSGPKYFLNTWSRHGVKFDAVYSYGEQVTPDQFYSTIPSEFRASVKYGQCTLASVPEENFENHPFIPTHIREKTVENDYVMFKLDIDRPKIEDGIIRYLLESGDAPLPLIDEMFWEHHITQNYLMSQHWESTATANTIFRQSYHIFLHLRKKGIRAHSWI